LLATAEDGGLPPVFQRLNKHGMPINILIIQAVIGSAFSLIFLLMPNVNSSYWILTALTAQLTVLMYIIIFVAAIRLRYLEPDTPRPYKVPGGNAGMWIVAGLGLLACGFTFFIGFVPPEQVKTGNILFYELFLALGIIVLSLPPFILDKIKKKSWGSEKKK
jgi:amino acid transporter